MICRHAVPITVTLWVLSVLSVWVREEFTTPRTMPYVLCLATSAILWSSAGMMIGVCRRPKERNCQ